MGEDVDRAASTSLQEGCHQWGPHRDGGCRVARTAALSPETEHARPGRAARPQHSTLCSAHMWTQLCPTGPLSLSKITAAPAALTVMKCQAALS